MDLLIVPIKPVTAVVENRSRFLIWKLWDGIDCEGMIGALHREGACLHKWADNVAWGGKNLSTADAIFLFLASVFLFFLISLFQKPLLFLSSTSVRKWKMGFNQPKWSFYTGWMACVRQKLKNLKIKSECYTLLLTESVSLVAQTISCLLLSTCWKCNCPHGNKQHFKMPAFLQGTWQIGGPACNINGRISLGFVSRREEKWQESLVRGQSGSRWD